MNERWNWRVLSDQQVEHLRAAAWDHIAQHGFVVQHNSLLARARARGAQVDEHQGRVRLSRTLSAELMAELPGQYTTGNILGDAWVVGGPEQVCTAIVTDPWIIDYASRQPRRPCLNDVRRNTIVAEQLEPVFAISRMDFPVTDVAGPTSSLRALEVHLMHHTRHYMVMAASLESFQQWMEIAAILSRGNSFQHLISSAIAVGSPLVLNQLNAELLVRSIAHGFPIIPTVCPMAGSTAPYSLAGTLLQSHMEVLMLALLTQILQPGHPVEYVSGLSVTDLRSGADLYYTFDKVLWKNAAVQLGLAEHMPVGAECGGTLTPRFDLQSGAEGMLFMLAAHASGAHRISGLGSCHNAVGMSAEMMVIQQAYLRAARHLSRGIRTDEPYLGQASLVRVGPGGQFLEDDLTLELLRSDEFFRDSIFDLDVGLAPGPSLLERAHARVNELVDHFESRVPGDIRENLQRYFAQEYKRLGHAAP